MDTHDVEMTAQDEMKTRVIGGTVAGLFEDE
jgi:hypothetical protein